MANHTDRAAAKALHDLIATCRDAEEGYGKAAKGVHSPQLSDRLATLSGNRGRFADELSGLVTALDAGSPGDAHTGGIFHQGWVDLEARIRPKNEIEIVRECIAGDQGTVKHYQHALTLILDGEARGIVGRQLKQLETEISGLESLTQKGRVQHA